MTVIASPCFKILFIQNPSLNYPPICNPSLTGNILPLRSHSTALLSRTVFVQCRHYIKGRLTEGALSRVFCRIVWVLGNVTILKWNSVLSNESDIRVWTVFMSSEQMIYIRWKWFMFTCTAFSLFHFSDDF